MAVFKAFLVANRATTRGKGDHDLGIGALPLGIVIGPLGLGPRPLEAYSQAL